MAKNKIIFTFIFKRLIVFKGMTFRTFFIMLLLCSAHPTVLNSCATNKPVQAGGTIEEAEEARAEAKKAARKEAKKARKEAEKRFWKMQSKAAKKRIRKTRRQRKREARRRKR